MVYNRILPRDPGEGADIANDLTELLQELEADPGQALTALMITTVRFAMSTHDPEQALNECVDILDVGLLEEI